MGASDSPSAGSLLEQLRFLVQRVSVDRWGVTATRMDREIVVVDVRTSAGPRSLNIWEVGPSHRRYRAVGKLGFAWASRDNKPPDAAERTCLDLLIDTIARQLPDILERARHDHASSGASGAVAAPALDSRTGGSPLLERLKLPAFPSPEFAARLSAPLDVPQEAIDSYRRDGFIVLRQVLDADALRAANPWLQLALERNWGHREEGGKPGDDYQRAFVQLWNLGLEDTAVRAIAHARRLGHVAAQLMGVQGVRIFCENWLLKRPGEGPTGWHQDACVFPFDAEATITAWIPLHPVTVPMGTVRFARGSHELPLVATENINEANSQELEEIIAARGLEVFNAPDFALGDVSFHNGMTIHGALGNTLSSRRDVLSVSMFADGARVRVPRTTQMKRQLSDLSPGLQPGDMAASMAWPRTFPTSDFEAQAGAAWFRLRATALPADRLVDLWIHDGLLRAEGPGNAPWLAPEGGFVLSGLVDAHSHISWPHTPADSSDTPLFMDSNRRAYAETGVTLLRDMGSNRDAVSRCRDEPGLPLVRAAGQVILRDDSWPLSATPPERLKAAMLERIERGAHWVKVFTDFTTDFQGDSHPGFTERDEVTYTLDVLAAATGAVHEAGGRVAAHCFTRAGAEVAIQAGVDSLEHGWGVDDALLEQMARARIAWVPLVAIASQMHRAARARAEHENMKWIEKTAASLRRLLPAAVGQGVPIFAGTDWFPHVTVPDEIAALHELGVPGGAALAAGSWAARTWLGLPGIESGARADLVLYRLDPRTRLAALFRPEVVVLGGRPVTPVRFDPSGERETPSA